MLLDSSQLSADSLARTAVILGVFVLLLFSSTTSIIIILANRNLNEVTGYYMISLATADLLWAVLIVPMSVYSSLVPGWNFMGDDSLLCKSSAYLQIVILTSTLFTFGWISVDRYSAFMKPSRYESDHTLTRCKCWIAFSWLTAILTALPVIVAKMEANYYHEYEFCVLNWTSAAAYSVTLAVLVVVPSLCTIIFTTVAIFSAIRKPDELEDVQRSALQTDQNFVVTMFVIVAFFLSWLPIIIVHFIPSSLMHPADTATMKFAFIWLAIGGSSSKFLVHIFVNREFRRSFCIPCFGREIDTSDEMDEMGEAAPTRSKSCVQICCFCLPKPSAPPRLRPRQHHQSLAMNSNSYFPFPPDTHPRESFNNFNGGTHSIALTEPFVGARNHFEYGTMARIPSGM
ncbi:G-PROTEIN-RECEP-F1-2 domain-containing protein [Aphelenchoides besseyi]|nr:G-PROTEIN-RECEP-F1-2 domain-containing protein [Aphelenchoides besseyi]KAI6232417.1 G-PROTEIN-RECEP-F1-2 domain-containing protein [Aphelenchoides besseyi]